MQNRIVSQEDWLKARSALLAREKAMTRAADELARDAQAMPWVEVTREYVFDGPNGKLSLADLFDGRSQLFVKHFMLEPGQTSQCVGCSLECDHVDGMLPHLNNHDITYVAMARAPIGEIEALRKRMSWGFPFVSTGAEFKQDFQRAFATEGSGGAGNNVFYRDEAGRIFHTWCAYARGGEAFIGTYRIIDLTPKGRAENGPFFSMTDWVRPRTMYGKGGSVERNGRYHAEACKCGSGPHA